MKKDLHCYLVDNCKRANAVISDYVSEYNRERLRKILLDINELVMEVSNLQKACREKDLDYITLKLEEVIK